MWYEIKKTDTTVVCGSVIKIDLGCTIKNGETALFCMDGNKVIWFCSKHAKLALLGHMRHLNDVWKEAELLNWMTDDLITTYNSYVKGEGDNMKMFIIMESRFVC
jgi:hypothetical protein